MSEISIFDEDDLSDRQQATSPLISGTIIHSCGCVEIIDRPTGKYQRTWCEECSNQNWLKSLKD